MQVEYRVKPVTRYIVTRHHQTEVINGKSSGSCETRGEFDNADTAYSVAYALCAQEHRASWEPLGSMNFIYPQHPERVSVEVAPSLLRQGNTHAI